MAEGRTARHERQRRPSAHGAVRWRAGEEWHRLAVADIIPALEILFIHTESWHQALHQASMAGPRAHATTILKGGPTARAACRAQVKQEKLRYIDPVAKEAMNATRTAFGADYEARLRAEAGAKPDKLSRRKHQISSLYHNAKMKARPRARSDLPGRGPGQFVQCSGAVPPISSPSCPYGGRPPCQPPCFHVRAQAGCGADSARACTGASDRGVPRACRSWRCWTCAARA